MKLGRERVVVRFSEGKREWRLPGLLNTDELVLCDELKDNLRVMMGRFIEVW